MEKLQSHISFNFTITYLSFLILLQFYLLARESLTSIFLLQFIFVYVAAIWSYGCNLWWNRLFWKMIHIHYSSDRHKTVV